MSSDKDALLGWVNLYTPQDSKVRSLRELGDGCQLGDILATTLPENFSADSLRRGKANWVLRKANVDKLLDSINTYVQTEHQTQFDATSVVDSARIANPETYDERVMQDFVEIVFTLCVASSKEALLELQKLDKTYFQLLQGVARQRVIQHGFRKPGSGHVKRDAARATSDPATPIGTRGGGSPPPEKVRVFGDTSSDPAVLLQENAALSAACREAQGKLTKLQATMTLEHEEYAQLQMKYEKLIGESTKGRSMRERELLSKLDEKESEINRLTALVENSGAAADALATEKEKHSEEITRLCSTIADLKATIEDLQSSKQNVYAEVVLAKDRLSLQMKRTDELEADLWTAREAQKRFNEQEEKKASEIAALNDQIEEQASVIRHLEADLAERRERISILEAAGGLARNLETRVVGHEDLSNTVDWLQGQVKSYQDLDIARREELAELRAKLTEYTTRTGSSYDEDEVQRLKKEVDTANAHLRCALEKLESPEAEEEKERLRQENEQLKESMDVGRDATRREQAAIYSHFFECGQRNLQLQIRQLMGETPIPTSELFALQRESDSSKLSFLEKHRRNIERRMLKDLATAAQSHR